MTGTTETRLARIEAILGIDPAAAEMPPEMTAIVAATARAFTVPVASIRGTARDVPAIRARFAAIWAIHHARPDLSLRQIGQALGRRDHTSILHAIRRAEEWRAEDETFRAAVDRIQCEAAERTELSPEDYFLRYIRGRAVCTLADAHRTMSNAGYGVDGPQIARMLRALGFQRDGWDGTGYDRTPRYRWIAP